jgi:hypothetical protein
MKQQPSSIELQALQAAFKQHLVADDTAIADYIVSTSDLSSDVRLAIYSNAYRARLVETLEHDYQALAMLLGEEAFVALAHRYIDRFPSHDPSLRWFGQHMPDFIAANPPYRDEPVLWELSVFEWTFTKAFDARDLSVVTQSDVARIPALSWPSLGIELHPSVHCFDYQWNVLPLWRALKGVDEQIPLPTRLDEKQSCLVWRKELATLYRSLEQDEAQVLKAAAEGADFAQMCEILGQYLTDPQQVALRAAGLLKTWIAAGLICRLRVEEQ